MRISPDRVEAVVMCACILHNILRVKMQSPAEGDIEDPITGEVIPASWRSDLPLSQVSGRSARSTQAAKELRDHLKNYFVSEAGSLPWQMAQI